MANEITTNFKLSYANGGDKIEIPNTQQKLSVASESRIQNVQEIGTSEEALALGDITTDGGAFYAQNLDDTNFVEIGLTGSYVIKLLPGQLCFLSGVSDKDLFARANTSPVKLAYALFS